MHPISNEHGHFSRIEAHHSAEITVAYSVYPLASVHSKPYSAKRTTNYVLPRLSTITALISQKPRDSIKVNRTRLMAKVNMMTHMDSVSGKYHHTDKVYTKIRKFDEQVIGVRLKNPVTNVPPSEKQAIAQQKMTTIVAQAKAIYADAEQLATYRAAWKKQKKIPTLIGYISAQLYKQSNTED